MNRQNKQNTTKKVEHCKKTFCPKMLIRQRKTLKKIGNTFAKAFKGKPLKGMNSMLNTPKMRKKMLDSCVKGYCNPSCKNTMFEAGKDFPKPLEKELKGQKRGDEVLNIIKRMRKSIFGKKNTVLKNDFYNGISKKNTKRLKKDGAISGCTVMVMKH